MVREPIQSDPRVPPHSIEAEQSVLGGLLQHPELMHEVLVLIAGEDFYIDSHRRIFRYLVEMSLSGASIDPLMVFDRIAQSNEVEQTGGLAYLIELHQAALGRNVARHAEIIRDRSDRRKLQSLANSIADLAESPGPQAATERVAVAFGQVQQLVDRIGAKGGMSPLNVIRAEVTQSAVFTDELIEDVLSVHGIAVVYGASNSGKTFLAIDMAAAIARGGQWMGKCCAKTAVLYLATESPVSVRQRISAYMQRHGLSELDVFVAQKPINLFESSADIESITEEVRRIERVFGLRVGLIIGDTMARIAAGANENSGEDMGIVMANADMIARRTEAAFLWIHHSGKDEAKGARGWSGIRAHIDTEIEIKDGDENGVHSAEITKQRDLNGKGTRFGFRLEVIQLGVNQWGNPRNTCVVIPEEAPEKKTGRPNAAEPAVLLYLEQKGAGARVKEMVEALEGKVSRSQVYACLDKLRKSGKVECVAGVYAVIG